jgi:hypothetical protein
MSLALSSISSDDLVVFELDNTVMTPRQTLGSDQWWGALVKKNLALGMNEDQALEGAIKDWIKVHKVTKVRALEINSPALISALQKRRIPTFALTARPQKIKNRTILQLKSLRIQFPDIVFLGPKQSKGEVLFGIVGRITKKPKRVIFIDDKVKHVLSADNAFKNYGMVNLNFRYSAADQDVKNYNQEIADNQWFYFIHFKYYFKYYLH